MSKTENNLMEAFAGESQANRKYLAFAKQADAGRLRSDGQAASELPPKPKPSTPMPICGRPGKYRENGGPSEGRPSTERPTSSKACIRP